MQNQQTELKGAVYLYQQPELLTVEKHRKLGVTGSYKSAEFARAATSFPISQSEMSVAQRHYPIVFGSADNPLPIIITGFENLNLFVDEDGMWQEDCYVPAYVRCYPFAFARSADGKMAVVIDRAAPMLAENADIPLFDGDELSAEAKKHVEFCGSYDAEKARTVEAMGIIKELDLLRSQELNRTVEGTSHTVARYTAIDADRVAQLDNSAIGELYRSGIMELVYAHLFSLDNWRLLLQRYDARRKK